MEAPENRPGVEVGRVTVQDKDQPGSPNWLAKFTILEGDPRGAFSIHPDPLTNEGVISLAKVRKSQALLWRRGNVGPGKIHPATLAEPLLSSPPPTPPPHVVGRQPSEAFRTEAE